MRRFAAKTVSVFRIAYVAVAVALGSALTAISVGSLWQGIQVATTIVGEPTTQFDPTTGTTVIVNPYVLDGPDPLSFYNYGRAPVMAATFLLIGFMTLKRRWEALSFTCWFLAAPVIVEILSGIFYYGWGSAFSLLSISALWAYVPFVGIVIAAVARSCRSGGESRVTPSVAADDLSIYRRMPLDAVFAVVAVASYLWRVTDVALSPEATRAIDHFLGAPNEYAPNAALVAGSVVGLGAAAALLAGVLMPIGETRRIVDAALAFTLGLTFAGLLETLDVVFDLQTTRNVGYAVQEAIAFVACAAALAFTARRRRFRVAPA